MPAIPSLPVEIWQDILRRGIAVPDFLYPESFEVVLSTFQLWGKHCERNNEATYWLAEKHRNRFRRTCRSWNEYLGQFEHRFVRMLDIWHGKIPPTVLKNAFRVNFGRYKCKCSKFCAPEIYKRKNHSCRFTDRWEGKMFFGEVCGPLLEEAGTLDKLLIVDAEDEVLWYKGLLQLSKSAPQLKVFLGRIYESIGYCHCLYSTDDIADYPDINGHCRWGLPRGHREVLFASSLVSMCLTDFGRLRDGVGALEWSLPSLRHLRIINGQYAQGQSFLEHAVYPLLQNVGGNLYTLYLGDTSQYDLPIKIWEMCPRLEKLGTTMRLVSPPPISHPFNTYVAPTYYGSDVGFWGGVEFLHWPHLQRVVVDWVWSNTHRWDHISPEWRKVCAERNVRIEDQNGITWDEFSKQGSRPRAFILNLVSRTWV